MNTQDLSTFFIAIIFAWSVWSIFSRRVRDGVVGKLIYASIAISGFAIITRAETVFITPTVAGVTFHASLAFAGARHIFMVTWWPQVKRWACYRLGCEGCIHDPRFGNGPGKVERRARSR